MAESAEPAPAQAQAAQAAQAQAAQARPAGGCGCGGGRCGGLAEKLWPWPLRAVARNPRKTALVYAGVNGVFVGVGELVALLVSMLTVPGFVALVLASVLALVYNVARLVVYPGMIPNVQRSLEREIAREVRRNLLQNLEPHVQLLKLLVNVHQSLPQIGHTQSVHWLKDRLTELSRLRMQASMSTLEPVAETLRSIQDAKKDHKLLHGGADLLSAIADVNELDALLEELVVSPAVHALQTNGMGAFAAAIAPSVESLGRDMILVAAVDSVLDLPAIQPSRRPESELRDAPWLVLADLAAAVKVCAERAVFFEEVKEAPLTVLPDQGPAADIELGIRVRSDSDADSAASERTHDVSETDTDRDAKSALGGDSEEEGSNPARAAVTAAARAAGTSAAAAAVATRKLRLQERNAQRASRDLKAESADKLASGSSGAGLAADDEVTDDEEDAAQEALQSAAEGGTLALSGGKLAVLLEEFRAARRPMPAVANLEFMRYGLQTRFSGEQAWVSSYGGVHIDTMFLPAKHAKYAADQRTILVCNPNCGYYEFAAMQNQWVHFYTELGFNVLLFNYRGYGRSEGWPRPYALQMDGEALVEYLTRRKGVQHGWIGIHAESIGGVVACHLAHHAARFGISFMVADRTLCDLPTTAANMLGNWAAIAIQAIGWHADNATGFLAAPNSLYRVCTCDPNDEIIANNASLKSGVARKLVAAACRPLPTAINEEQHIALIASSMLGAPLDRESFDLLWVRDPAFSVSFALAAVQMLEAQRQLTRLPPVNRNRTLVSTLHSAVHVLWYTDGSCGESLGSPLSRYYHEWRNFQRPQNATPEHVANLINKASIKWIVALQDWLANLLVWGFDAPPVKDLVSVKDITQARRAMHSIKGRRIVCGALHPVPLSVAAEVFEALKDDPSLHSATGIDVNLGAAIDTVSNALAKILDTKRRLQVHREAQPDSPVDIKLQPQSPPSPPQIQVVDAEESSAPPAPVRPATFLLPLNCGHNGRMGPPALKVLHGHLVRAGWLSAP